MPKRQEKKSEKPGSEKPGIEESLIKIENLIEKLEEPQITLEEAFELYEEGIKLVKQAGEGIAHVEKRMEILSEDADDE